MTQIPCPYDDRIRPPSYDSIIPEAENLRFVDATHPYLLPHTTPRVDVAHPYNHIPLSDPSSLHHGELNPPRPTHPSYSLLPAGSEPSGDIPTDCRNLGFPQPSEIYNPWGSFHPSPNVLLNAAYVVSPPTFHHPTSDSTLYPNSSCRQSPWPTGNNQVNFVDEFLPAPPSDYLLTTLPLHNSGPSPPHPNFTSQPYSGTLDASYPCLWTEGGITCNVMVQATRAQMNRHLHAYHGFGGSDTRQTRCCWTGCGETMQQGSIARHMVTCHLQAKVTCPTCSKKLSRQDVISKHQRVCPAASAWR